MQESRFDKRFYMNPSNKLLSDITAFRSYAKYLPHVSRRESLEETINRCMTMHLDNFPKLSKEIVKAFSYVHELKILPSMRSLQFAGNAITKNNIRQYNCFSRDTEFVTNKGIFTFYDFKDGDIVTVKTIEGWKPAVIRKFGEEELVELILRRGKRVKTIKTTKNHRWIKKIKRGNTYLRKEETTVTLKSGDALLYNIKRRSTKLTPCNVAIQHGIVFGYGTKFEKSTRITLCDDSTELKRYFSAGKIFNQRTEDTKRVTIGNLPYNWKWLPEITANKEYLLGFLMGWFAADGSIGKSGSNIALYSNNTSNLSWARDALSILDIYTDDIKLMRQFSPFDGSEKPLYKLSINTEDLFPEFFLKNKHKERFKILKKIDWIVDRVIETGELEDVWCVQEPVTETFTLANGCITKNCSYQPIDSVEAFGEALFILLCGTGLGYSVQKRHIKHLPKIQKPRQEGIFIVQDSIAGWSEALDALVRAYLYNRVRPVFDFSTISPKGTYLVTTGTKAPGPEALKYMLQEVEQRLIKGIGRQLRPIEIHDIICIISDCVLSGGIRRSALIALFDRDDEEMLHCKSGDWGLKHPYRARANNSAVLPRGETTYEEFCYIYKICQESKAGEPGFVWTNDLDWGVNPCAEIGLNPFQFCNLTTVNQTGIEDKRDFLQRIQHATFLGTLQAAYTDFPYLRPKWKETTEREALIGVSFTGIADAGNIVTADWLRIGSKVVLDTNEKTSKKLSINYAARTTCNKPEGSGSCIVCSSSGTGDRHDDFYLRRIRINKDDSLAKYLAIVVPDLIENDLFSPNTVVLTIPQESPPGASLRRDSTALSMFDRVTMYYENWILPGHRSGANTHNVSCTINVRDDEWENLRERMWTDRDKYAAISLLPFDTGVYKQAPFESCSKEKYEELSKIIGNVDLRDVFEDYDNTNRMQNFACTGGQCEVTW